MNNKVWFHQPIQPIQSPRKHTVTNKQHVGQFQDVFQKTLESFQQQPIKFSAHALKRMEERGIHLSDAAMEKLENAVDNVAQKGARDALVLMDQVAYVVSVSNKTVITAMDEKSTKENIFTNIDSAVIL